MSADTVMGGGDVIALVDPSRWNFPDAPQLAYANGHADALAASPPVGGWEDISTAPKDGTCVLVIDQSAIAPKSGPGWFVEGIWTCTDPTATEEMSNDDRRDLLGAVTWREVVFDLVQDACIAVVARQETAGSAASRTADAILQALAVIPTQGGGE